MSEIKDKLIEVLKINNVCISNKGNICLNDLVNNIIKSSNSVLYIKKISDKKIKIKNNNDCYITPDNCLEILKQGKSKLCKEIIRKVEFNENDDESLAVINDKVDEYNIISSQLSKLLTSDCKKWLKNEIVPTIQETNNKIVSLNNVVDTYRVNDELRRLELEYKNSDNYQLELERDIKMKEIDLKIKEADIKIKKLDLEIEIERNKHSDVIKQNATKQSNK
uniref:Uncharacterized protein n=1 Tax=viral metagenome TaxID=1070528 RepID=A0A6C0LSZ2_9ZZZZ